MKLIGEIEEVVATDLLTTVVGEIETVGVERLGANYSRGRKNSFDKLGMKELSNVGVFSRIGGSENPEEVTLQ